MSEYLEAQNNNQINMETKIIHIRRTVDMAISVPRNESQEETEKWAREYFAPHHLKTRNELGDRQILDVHFIEKDDDQDNFTLVSWPESQALHEFEGYLDNCTFISGDSLSSGTYLVNRDWYSRLCHGELRKIEDFEISEETLSSYGI